MSIYDYTVFALYVAGMVAVAGIFYRRNKSFKDMFAAGGQSPWWVSGLSSYMTLFSAGTFVVWGGLAYKHGMVAISINMASGLAALLVGFFIASRWKALNIATPATYIELRFGRTAVHYYTWMLMLVRIIGSAVALYALSTILVPLLPGATDGNGEVSVIPIILICGLVIVAYTIIGGLWAVLMTDVLQFIVLSISVLFTVWLALGDSGGLAAFAQAVPVNFLDFTSAGYSWFFLLGWCAIHLFMLGAEWAFVQRHISVPSQRDARKGALLFGVLYIVSPAIWLFPAMVYRTVDPAADPEQAYILMSQAVLPLGMLGLVAAAMFSATASMVSSQINVFAGVMTDRIYRGLLRPGASDGESVWAGRVAAALLGLAIIALAMAIPYLGGAEKVVFSLMSLFISPMFAPALWGLFSRHISASAVWLTAGVAVTLGVLLKYLAAPTGMLAAIPQFDGLVQWTADNARSLDIYIGVVAPLVVLSLLEIRGRLKARAAAGWLSLQSVAVDRETDAEASAADGRLPLMIVTWSVLACAAITTLLTLVNPGVRFEMATLSLLLFITAAILGRLLTKPSWREEPTNNASQARA